MSQYSPQIREGAKSGNYLRCGFVLNDIAGLMKLPETSLFPDLSLILPHMETMSLTETFRRSTHITQTG